MRFLPLCHAILDSLPLFFLRLGLLRFSLAFLLLLFLLQSLLLLFLQLLQPLLPLFFLLHYFPDPPLVLFPRQYLLELHSWLVLLLAALVGLPSDLLVKVLDFFDDILSLGLDLDLLLLFEGQLGRRHCFFRQGSCVLNEKDYTSGMTKDPFSRL